MKTYHGDYKRSKTTIGSLPNNRSTHHLDDEGVHLNLALPGAPHELVEDSGTHGSDSRQSQDDLAGPGGVPREAEVAVLLEAGNQLVLPVHDLRTIAQARSICRIFVFCCIL